MEPATAPPFSAAICQQARLTRDARFDGLFFTAVRTTGIYCRPVCPAPTPHERNIVYFSSAAAASAAGFRPCLRCRPEAAPGSPLHRARSELVRAALRLIEDGALDDAPLATLAARIGVGERHLRRLFAEELGASPLDVAATRRLLFAKQLLIETAMPVTTIAGAAGYASVRRFNAAFVAAYGRPPRDFRRTRQPARTTAAAIELTLPYRPPYDFRALLAFYARRAIPGVEIVDASTYRRSVIVDGRSAMIEVDASPHRDALRLRVHGAAAPALGALVARVRRMFDVDADPRAIAAKLRGDAWLRPLVKRWPGQRLPGAWDGFELAVRAVLGQQVSVGAARTLAARLVQRHGTAHPESAAFGLGALFPSPSTLAEADIEAIGLPRARATAIRAIAQATLDGRIGFGAEQTLTDFVARLAALPGIGAWTAHYIAMRALSQPDAFPAGDLVLRKLAGDGKPVSERAMETRAEAWRPWRAYAVMLLWRSAA
ncbi:AlkA N-terminal domain-containing protein [Dokdonella sp.]|uniref:AlkA N-terminal domain-containing protein n=1 Tax=Dokdonella sp. TaxID=2291710 RepID=UPI0025BE8CA0|nr:AlkA N-terminal domain-containing protein [Dokdonella sp.]MBX3691061.1 DNA-3-methyladenine glycosylase 2 family protein [Dokdonella sp.]MCW5566920.1 DNA-3-methyladenine glycosylase 2 family protein [Dokdonella sp.]